MPRISGIPVVGRFGVMKVRCPAPFSEKKMCLFTAVKSTPNPGAQSGMKPPSFAVTFPHPERGTSVSQHQSNVDLKNFPAVYMQYLISQVWWGLPYGTGTVSYNHDRHDRSTLTPSDFHFLNYTQATHHLSPPATSSLPRLICTLLSSPTLTTPTSASQQTPNTFTPSPATLLPSPF